jgi:hypothetical protein
MAVATEAARSQKPGPIQAASTQKHGPIKPPAGKTKAKPPAGKNKTQAASRQENKRC